MVWIKWDKEVFSIVCRSVGRRCCAAKTHPHATGQVNDKDTHGPAEADLCKFNFPLGLNGTVNKHKLSFRLNNFTLWFSYEYLCIPSFQNSAGSHTAWLFWLGHHC